jgi:hypothetical protein
LRDENGNFSTSTYLIAFFVVVVIGLGLYLALSGSPAPTDVPATTAPGSAGPPTASPTLARTAPPTPTATALAPTATVSASPDTGGDMAPAVNLEIEPVDGEPNAFILHWEYPTEGTVVPESFDITVNGVFYESVGYEGTDFNYSWYVGEQPCSGPAEVTVVAVNEDVTASSDPVTWEGC